MRSISATILRVASDGGWHTASDVFDLHYADGIRTASRATQVDRAIAVLEKSGRLVRVRKEPGRRAMFALPGSGDPPPPDVGRCASCGISKKDVTFRRHSSECPACQDKRKAAFNEKYGPRHTQRAVLARKNRELSSQGLRECRLCGQRKSVECFYRNLSKCRECQSAKFSGIHKTNRALAESGLKHCTTCGEDKPIDKFYSHGSKCRSCKDAYVSAWAKRKSARLTTKAKPSLYAWHYKAQTRIKRESLSFESRLSSCVDAVFRREAKVCPCCGEDKSSAAYGWLKKGRAFILNKRCRKCEAAKVLSGRKKNPEKTREARRRHRQNRQRDPEWRKRMAKKKHRRLMERVAAGDPVAIKRREAQQARGLTVLVRRRVLFPELVKEKIYRSVVFNRDGGCCQYCGVELQNVPGGWEMDHVFPLSRGGEHSYGNVVVSCRACNAEKNDKMLLDFLWEREQRQQAAA